MLLLLLLLLNKDRLVLIKYIVARMADLNPFPPNCSEEMKYEIFDRVEEKLLKSYKYELIDILKSEKELRMICSDMKNSMLKEIIKSIDDDDIDSDVSDISDDEDEISELNSSNYVDMIERLTKGRKSHVKIKFA